MNNRESVELKSIAKHVKILILLKEVKIHSNQLRIQSIVKIRELLSEFLLV